MLCPPFQMMCEPAERPKAWWILLVLGGLDPMKLMKEKIIFSPRSEWTNKVQTG